MSKSRREAKKRKLTMMTHVVKPLKKLGFHFESLLFGDGYFLFNFGKNTVCHFMLKELPDVKFGIWLTGEKQCSAFCELLPYIDKFKPTRCPYVFETFNELVEFILQFKNLERNSSILKFMKEGDWDYVNEGDTDEQTLEDYYDALAVSVERRNTNGMGYEAQAKAKEHRSKKVKELMKMDGVLLVLKAKEVLGYGRYADLIVVTNEECDEEAYSKFDRESYEECDSIDFIWWGVDGNNPYIDKYFDKNLKVNKHFEVLFDKFGKSKK